MTESSWQPRYARWLEVTAPAGLVFLGVALVTPEVALRLFVPWLWGQMIWLFVIGRAPRTAADRVTLARLGGMTGLALAGVFELAGAVLFGLAVAIALADLLDGWVARRFGASAFGAVLDMESDQCFVTLLSILALARQDMPGWLLLFPALRYLHLLLLRLARLPAKNPKPKAGNNSRARLVCALVVTVLVLNLWPTAAAGLRLILSATGLGLLLWSFSDDFVYLWRQFRHPRAAI